MTALPWNAEAEAALIQRLLIEPAQVPTLLDTLRVEDFHDRDARDAWRAMVKLSSERKPVDIVSISAEVGRKIDIDVFDLSAAHKAPIDTYAEIIKRDAWRRRYIGILDAAQRRAYEEDDPQKLLADLQDGLTEIVKGVDSGHLISPNQGVDLYERTLMHRLEGTDRGLSWGIPSLDAVLRPAMPGDFIVIGARPSVGKTVLVQQLAVHWAAAAEYPVLFVSLEMSMTQLLDRLVGGDTGIDPVMGLLNSPDKLALARESAQRLRSVQCWILDNPSATTASIRAAAAKVKMLVGGISGIVVDYLQLVSDPHEHEVTRVTRVSRALKAIAREFDVPLLAPSQLSRQADGREPRLADLRESGAIEQDADTVLGLYRADLDDPNALLEVLKDRQGGKAGRRFSLYLNSNTVRFEEPTKVAA